MSANQDILAYLEGLPAKQIILARKVKNKFPQISDGNLLKILERECLKQKLSRISKGIYYKNSISKFGMIPISEEEIKSFFVGPNYRYGIISGYDLFNQYNLTTQISKNTIIYSKISIRDKGKIGNTVIIKLPKSFHHSMKETMEFAEILDNYQQIEDLNRTNFLKYCTHAAFQFNESHFQKIQTFRKYKKRTIAFLKLILDTHKVSNHLGDYLNSTSRYQIPTLEELHEITSEY